MSNLSVAVPSTVYSCVLTVLNAGTVVIPAAVQTGALAPLNNIYPSCSRLIGVSGGIATNKYRVYLTAGGTAGFSPAITVWSSSNADTSILTLYWVNEVAPSPNFGGDVANGVATVPVAIQPC